MILLRILLCVLGLILTGVLIRLWVIHLVDQRISNYQNDLMNRHIEEVNEM